MSIPPTTLRKAIRPALQSIIGIAVLIMLAAVSIYAQTQNTTYGTTPLAVSPGAPAGSYQLSGFDNVNLYNGHLNFRLPLITVGGRGAANYPITLPLQQIWTTDSFYDSANQTTHYYPSQNWWSSGGPGFSPGVLQIRYAGIGKTTCQRSLSQTDILYNKSLTRLTFTAPNGTEYELRDKATGGQAAVVGTCATAGFLRGKEFVTADGTAATFISDTDIYDQYDINANITTGTASGYLILRDGTRYRIDGSRVSWMRDRNGNKLTFTNDINGRVTLIVDSLNRQITIAYGVTEAAPYGLCDKITYKGFNGADRIIRISRTSLGSALASSSALQTYKQLFPLMGGSISQTFNPTVVSAVWLPDGRSYQFSYNSYGELARVVMPTGGACEYSYAAGLTGSDASGAFLDQGDRLYIYRRVVEKRVYADGTNLTDRMTYSRPEDYAAGTNAGYVVVDQFDAGGALLGRDKHYFYGSTRASFRQATQNINGPLSYPGWQEGREYQTEIFDIVNNTPVLKKQVVQTWQQPVAGSDWPLAQAETSTTVKANNPQVTQSVTTLSDTNQVTKQSFAYGAYSNQTDVYEYDYGDGAAPAHPTRHTHTDYLSTNAANGLNYQTDTSIHLRGLPTGKKVYAVNTSTGTETLLAQDEVRYDEAGYPLLPCNSIIGWVDPLTTARGNATTTRRWLDTDNSYLETHAQYDQAGNLRSGWDAKGFQTQIDYTDAFSDAVTHNSYAYPTRTVSPIPGAPYGSTTALEATTVYDFSTGLVTSTTDANNQLTSVEYNDPLERPTKVVRPSGGGWTTYEYTTSAYGDRLHVQTLLNSSGTVADSYQFFDGLGRAYRSFQYEGVDPNNIYLTTDTQYDALGRVRRVSNTYRSVSAAGAVNPSGNWTTTAYDALGRVTSVTTPDNAVVMTSYSGNQVTVTDQAGKKRRSFTDALGRMTQVIEDPTGLAYQTDYLYDALGNLRKVTQGTQKQTRFFMYDSLSRLIRAKNPEQDVNASLTGTDPVTGNTQWVISYAYDANGNLSSRTDARGVTSSYVYDSLNRNTEVNYSDGSNIRRFYDGSTNGRGREWASYRNPTNGTNSHTAVDGYDAVGRVLVRRQQFYYGSSWSAAYNLTRTYDLAGHVATQTYPSGRTVSYSYDRMGRMTNFSGNIGDGVSRTYMSALAFDDGGRMTREQFGTDTPLYNKRHYNVRGQLYDVRLSSVNDDSDWNRGAIVNYYSLLNSGFGASGTDNNGNIHIQQTWIPGGSYMQQNYGYDSLNRISSVGEYQNGATQTGVQNYTYDRWGNRIIAATSSGTGINVQQFTVDADTNRLGVPTGQAGLMSYDANGNLINDTYSGFGMRTYDPENRMVTASDNGGGQSQYIYDADGHRVRRQTGAQQTWQVYGIEGEMVAEYAAGAAATAPQKEYGYRNGELLIKGEAPTSTGINVAQKRAATQSSDLVAGVAGRAVDGNTNGDWNYSSVTHTDYNNQGWWEVDLGSVQPLSNIKVWNRTDCCGSRLSNFYIFVSDVPFTSHDLTITMGQSGVASYYTTGAAGTSVTQAVNRTGRYVRVQLAGADYLSLAEVQVFSANAAGGIEWLVSDQLGTPRMVADKSGTLSGIKRHDYLPFGEELFAGTGGRTTAQGYVADGVRQKFTQKERDVETGLDYFLARYYSSTQGRFTSPDEFKGGPDELFVLGSGATEKQALPYADVINPQSLNKYQYTYNNPLRYTDPDGHMPDGESIWDRIHTTVQAVGQRITDLLDPEAAAREERPRGPLPSDGGMIAEDTLQKSARGVDKVLSGLEFVDRTGGVGALRAYAKNDKAGVAINLGMGIAGMVSGGGGGRSLLKEVRSLARGWSTQTTFNNKTWSLIRHAFAGHGKDVEAKNILAFLRKAASFNTRNARREVFDEGRRIRYTRKDGTYIIKDASGNTVSFGRN